MKKNDGDPEKQAKIEKFKAIKMKIERVNGQQGNFYRNKTV